MINEQQIDHIYKLYGYEKLRSEENVIVYRFRQGIYYAVDILRLSKNIDIDNIKNEYAKIGYATETIDVFDNDKIDKIESRLFSGFFEIDQTSSRLRNKYSRYKNKLSDRLGAAYEYITCPFSLIYAENENEELILNKKNNLSIIDTIAKFIKSDKAHLIVIEAAAGFGKTSTVYEVLNQLTLNKNNPLPIFIELSKNRQAKIFKHVLLNEFENIYPFLKFELVLNEIQSGKIPLIIDGFDELLYTSHSRIEENPGEYEDIQAMLQTIGEIIRKKAKIILTTRRTAVLSGDDFFKWASDNAEKFLTTRLLIERPNIGDWIGSHRYRRLSESGIPIKHISNPVLLSYIRNLEDSEFEGCCCNSELLINNYFEKLLIREQDRQQLHIEPKLQIEIFKKLAKNFVEYSINSEDKSFIKDLIVDENEQILKDIIQKYPPSERPSIDDLAETLCNHALLDRKGSFEKQIGFINDFVYGYLIASFVCEEKNKWIENYFIYENYIELSTLAFKLMPQSNKSLLWEKIEYISEVIDHQTLLLADIYLLDKAKHQFREKEFGSLEINNAKLGDCSLFIDCVFTDCVFTDTIFSPASFVNVSFVGNCFRNCAINGDIPYINISGERWVLGGEDYGNGFIDRFIATKDENDMPEEIEIDYEKRVLEQFWLPGREYFTNILKVRTLYRGFNSSKNSPINTAIKNLTQKGWLFCVKDSAIINKSYLNDIRKLLGR